MNTRDELLTLKDALSLSQGDVAALLGRSRKTVSQWMTGAYATPEWAVQRLRDVQRIRALTAQIELFLENRQA